MKTKKKEGTPARFPRGLTEAKNQELEYTLINLVLAVDNDRRLHDTLLWAYKKYDGSPAQKSGDLTDLENSLESLCESAYTYLKNHADDEEWNALSHDKIIVFKFVSNFIHRLGTYKKEGVIKRLHTEKRGT